LLTRKEFCHHILYKAEQKFGKKMGDLDVFYAPDVGVALEYLGQVEDPGTLETINSNPAYLFVTKENKYLSYKELLNLLPDDKHTVKDIAKKEAILITENDLKYKLGERKFYRMIDVIENLTQPEIDAVMGYLNFVKKEFEKVEYIQSNPLEA
jgi:hypothetical protein